MENIQNILQHILNKTAHISIHNILFSDLHSTGGYYVHLYILHQTFRNYILREEGCIINSNHSRKFLTVNLIFSQPPAHFLASPFSSARQKRHDRFKYQTMFLIINSLMF